MKSEECAVALYILAKEALHEFPRNELDALKAVVDVLKRFKLDVDENTVLSDKVYHKALITLINSRYIWVDSEGYLTLNGKRMVDLLEDRQLVASIAESRVMETLLRAKFNEVVKYLIETTGRIPSHLASEIADIVTIRSWLTDEARTWIFREFNGKPLFLYLPAKYQYKIAKHLTPIEATKLVLNETVRSSVHRKVLDELLATVKSGSPNLVTSVAKALRPDLFTSGEEVVREDFVAYRLKHRGATWWFQVLDFTDFDATFLAWREDTKVGLAFTGRNILEVAEKAARMYDHGVKLIQRLQDTGIPGVLFFKVYKLPYCGVTVATILTRDHAKILNPEDFQRFFEEESVKT